MTGILVGWLGQVESGHVVLVHAAAGGVGSLLCQWANALGATVIGTVSTEEKASQAMEDGCHHVIVYTKEDFVAAVEKITSGKGVNVVYDSVGKDTFNVHLSLYLYLSYHTLYLLILSDCRAQSSAWVAEGPWSPSVSRRGSLIPFPSQTLLPSPCSSRGHRCFITTPLVMNCCSQQGRSSPASALACCMCVSTTRTLYQRQRLPTQTWKPGRHQALSSSSLKVLRFLYVLLRTTFTRKLLPFRQ